MPGASYTDMRIGALGLLDQVSKLGFGLGKMNALRRTAYTARPVCPGCCHRRGSLSDWAFQWKIQKRYIFAVCTLHLRSFVSFAMSMAGVWVLSIQEGAVSVDGEGGRNKFSINLGVDVGKLCSFS